MSHTVVHEFACPNLNAVKAAASKLGAKLLGHGKYQFYSSSANGFGIQLPGWRYPVVVDTNNGKLSFDNYNGRWGNIDQLNKFKQQYSVEAITAEARMQNSQYSVATQDNGEIIITVGAEGYAVAGDEE